jgi:excinuclease ABC subunit C
VQKIEGVRAMAPELVRPMNQLRAVILQASAEPNEVAVFLFEDGRLRGPAAYSTLGMRIQNEQSGSSSLFAQPMNLEPIPEVPQPSGNSTPESAEQIVAAASPSPAARSVLEGRMEATLAELAANAGAPTAAVRQGHLALLKRWYYRPEAKRTGEICFPDGEGHWPIKAILRSIGRVAAKALTTAGNPA